MKNVNVETIVKDLQLSLPTKDSSSFNYERILLVDNTPYLDAFIENIENKDKVFPPFEIEIQMSSKCNLQCRWCIGDELQEKNYVMRLPNHINNDNIDNIVDGIINFQIDGLGIEIVKFSGFIGEPLVTKEATIKAIQRLVGAGKKVGLFTNGVLIDENTCRTLVNIDYVHISLDADPTSFFWFKESHKDTYTQETFEMVINNIRNLSTARANQCNRSRLRINIGYVVVPGNHDKIYKTARLVKKAGADSIRFKCDIGERYVLKGTKEFEKAIQQIEKIKQNLECPTFTVHTIHSEEDIEKGTYKDWQL